MSSYEKLFIQIFDRKNWIVDQLKQQKYLYDQYLASTLLINGIRPPSWLLSTGFHVGSADLKELKKEELISGLLFPPPRPNIPCIGGGHSSHYNRPIVSASNGWVSDALFTETCASNKYLDVEDVSTQVPKCRLNDSELDLGCALEGVPELDNIVTSPQDQMETRMNDVHFEPDQSLAKIQRSRSRQKALELRNSGNLKSKKRPRKDNYTGAYTGRVTRSRTCKVPNESIEPHDFSVYTNEEGSELAQSRYDTQNLNLVDKSLQPPSSVNGDDDPQNASDTQELAQSFRSGNKDLECIEAKTVKYPCMGDIKFDSHVRKVPSITTQLQQENSSKNLNYRVTRSRSALINNSSKEAKLFDGVEGNDLLLQSDSQRIATPCNDVGGVQREASNARHDVGGVVQLEVCNASILETKLVSNVPDQTCSIDSGINLVGGLEVRSVNLLSDNNMLLEPKLLVFDEIEHCHLINTSTPLEKEKLEISPEVKAMSLKATESLRKLTTPSDIQKQHDLSVNEPLLERERTPEAANSERSRKASCDYYEKESVSIVLMEKPELVSYPRPITAQISNSPPLSSGRVTSKSYGVMVADKPPESNKISKHGTTESSEQITNLSNLQVKCKFPVDELLPENDQTVEVSNNEGKLKSVPGNYEVDRLCDVTTDKSELDLCSTSANRISNLSARSALKGAPDEGLFTNAYAQNSKSSWQKTIEASEKVSIANDDKHEKCGIPVEMVFLEGDQTMEVARGEDHQGASSEAFEERSKTRFCAELSTGKSSNISSPSPGNGTTEIYEDFVASASQEGNKISKKSTGSSDHLSACQVIRSPLASQQQGVGINMPDVDVNPREGNFVEKCIVEINMLPDKTLPEDSKHDIDRCDGPQKTSSLGFNDGTGVSLPGIPEIFLSSQRIGSSSVVSTDAAKIISPQMTSAPNTSQMHNSRCDSPYFLRSNTIHDVNVKANGSLFANKAANSTNVVHFASENSWPVYKRRKIDGQSTYLFTTSPRLMRVKPCKQTAPVLDFHHFPLSHMEVAYSNGTAGTGADLFPGEKCNRPMSPNSLAQKGELDVKDRDGDAENLLGLERSESKSSFDSIMNKETCFPHGNLKGNVEVADNDELVFNLKGQFASEVRQKFLSLESALDTGSMEKISSMEGSTQEKEPNIGKAFSCHPLDSPHDGDLDSIVADQNLPEFEGFSIGAPTESVLPCIAGDGISWDQLNLPSSTSERISVLEQLCRSASVLTPLPSSKYKLHETPGIYKSLPNGTLERNLRDTVLFSNDDIERLKTTFNFMDVEVNDSSFCDSMSSSSGIQFSSDARKPSCTPPVRKLCQRITSSSSGHSSERQHSMNPELTCFRIDEDASTSEENGSNHEVFDPLPKEATMREKNSATNRRPLVDRTNAFNPCASISVTEKFHENHDRGSLDSVNTESNFHMTQMEAKQKRRNGFGKETRSKNKDKENQNSSIGVNGLEKNTELLQNRFSRSKLSGKATEKNGNQSFLDKGYKHNNIVSNVSSFIPLVQQKHQSTAVYTGKRDIKVKALEAAEAAKRLEEKKENDRKLKKEASKLERARLEQEKLRQLELQQKKKEEERKKKEADIAARKRLREEEERKEKERKRKCTEEARRQPKEQEKLRAEREEREQQRRPAGDRELKRKPLQIEERNHQRTEKVNQQADCREQMNTTDTGTSNIPAVFAMQEKEFREDLAALQQPHDKVAINACEVNQDGVSSTEAIGAESYELSPYKDSDDEDEEDEEMPNNKFVPSWARGKHLASVLPFTQQIEPCEIFTPARNCSITEVMIDLHGQRTCSLSDASSAKETYCLPCSSFAASELNVMPLWTWKIDLHGQRTLHNPFCGYSPAEPREEGLLMSLASCAVRIV